MGVAAAGARRYMPSAGAPSADMLDCETLPGMKLGCPTAPSVAAACSSVCVVDVGGGAGGFDDTKLGAADAAVLAVTGRRHLSSVMSSVGRQIDKM